MTAKLLTDPGAALPVAGPGRARQRPSAGLAAAASAALAAAVALAGLGLALLGAAGPARAGDLTVRAPAAPVAFASFADLDLARPADRKRLHARIVVAATQVCLDTALDPLMLDGAREACWRSAIRAGDRAAQALAREGRRAAGDARQIAVRAR